MKNEKNTFGPAVDRAWGGYEAVAAQRAVAQRAARWVSGAALA
jgi:hypothetical protein